MLSIRSRVAIVLAVVFLLCVPAASWAQTPQDEGQAAATGSHEVPAALVEVPEGQSVVTYRNGELTIKARNAPLIDVLQNVCNQIGAVLDAPPDVDEQILAALGPAPPKDVLASLLSGSRLNYGTAGTADDPNALARLVVFPKAKDSEAQPTKDPEAQNQVTQPQITLEPAAQPQTAVSVTEESGTQPLLELLDQAKAELSQAGDGITADATKILQQFEAQIKAAAATAEPRASSSPQTEQPASTTQPAGSAPTIRHRRR